MSKLFNWAAARLAAAFALALPLAAMAVTTAGYTDFGDTAGVVLWRGTEANFHASTVIDVAADGTPGTNYQMTADNTATSWQRFARGQSAYTSPGMVLVYDTPGSDQGYKYNPDCTFTPISFGGMWVKTLAINGQPFSILGNNAGKRYTEFGASDMPTLFKFDASFTINRTSTTTFFGEATVDIAQDATFTAQANSSYGVVVDSAATLKLKGPGTLAVTTMDVVGTLDLSETTRPAIAGNVTLEGTIVLPAETVVSPESPFTVCSGTLSAANVNVKIGDAEAVVKRLTTSGGAITALGDPVYEYTENYPTLVPAGQVYTFIGGDTAETATTASVVTVNGTLKTRGYISLTGLTTAKESMLEVVDGTATVTASATQSMSGDIKIDAGATLVNALGADALNYGWSEDIYVYGTLDMGGTRWTVGSSSRIYLYENAVITGAGQGSNGAIDITSSDVRVIAHGTSTISANMRVRASNIPVQAVEGKTLTISGLINDGAGYSQPGSITKQNSGTLVLTTAPTFTKALKLEAGTLELGGTAASSSVTVAASAATVAASSGSTLTGDLTFVAHVPSSANKALIASESFTGKVILTGDYGSSDPVSLAGLGNAVTLKDFTGFLNQGWDATSTRITIEGTFTQNNGWSGSASDVTQNAVYIAELLGDGTMTQSGAQKQSYIVGNIANFTGTFNFANSRIKSNNNAVLDKAQTIATLTVADTLTVNGGSLVGNLVASNVAVTVEGTPAAGDVLVPVSGTASVSGTVTVNGNKAVVECVTGEGVKFVAYLVSVNVPKVANTTIEVSVGGTPVTPATEGETTNTYSVAEGAMVTVTYSSDDYEVSGGSFEFTASEGYTVDTTEVVTKQYVASITTGELVVKYTSLQAAIDATAQTNSKIVLLANEEDGATIPAVDGKMFYFYAGEFTHGEIANAEGNFITTSTEEVISIGGVDVTATKYRVNAAVALVVLANEQAGTYYGDPMLAYNAFLAGPGGTTMQVFGNNPFSTEIPCTTYDSETQTYTKLEAVASITVGQVTSNYPSLADAVAAAEAGQTVTMLADDRVSFAAVTVEDGVPSGGSIVIDKNLTIDGSGFTVYGNTNADILNATGSATPGRDMVADLVDGSNLLGFFVKSGNVTFQNVTLTEFGNTAYVNKFGYTPIQTASAYTGKLTLTNVNFNKFNRTAVCVRGGTLEMTGGTVSGGTVNKNNGDYFQQPLEVRGGSATISGVTITGGDDVAGNGGGAIVAWGDTTVNNVSIDFTGIGVWADVADVAITGDDTEILATTQSVFVEEGGSATIAAGDFAGSLAVDSDENSSITVSGGTFDAAVPEEFCAEGFMPVDNGDGTYGVREDKGWIYAAPGYWNYTGTWSEGATLGEEKVTIEDGATYTASEASDGRFVTVAMTLSFDDVNDEDEGVGDAKAAVKLATGGFKVYTSEGPDGAVTSVWKSVTIDGLDLSPQVNEDYTFLFVLDLTNTTYTAALITSGGAATNALVLTDGSVANIPFASRGNVAPVQKIEFIGSGSVTSIEGSYEDVPVPEGFVEDEVVTLAGDDTATLTAAQATWLNACGAKAAVAAKIATMDSTAFNNAYLLNLDITGEFGYEFKVTAIEVGDDDVTVTVSLTRTGALDETTKINGAVVLTGTDELGKTFETIDEAAVADDDFSESNTTTITLDKGDAKFFRPVIEIIAPKGE